MVIPASSFLTSSQLNNLWVSSQPRLWIIYCLNILYIQKKNRASQVSCIRLKSRSRSRKDVRSLNKILVSSQSRLWIIYCLIYSIFQKKTRLLRYLVFDLIHARGRTKIFDPRTSYGSQVFRVYGLFI